MRKKVISLGLISLLSFTVLIGCGEKEPDSEKLAQEEKVIKKAEEKPKDYVPVSVEKLKPRDISETTTFSGEIVPKQEVTLVPQMPGKVESLNVKVGDVVYSDEIVFTLDNSDIQNQVNQADQALSSAESSYDQAKEQKEQAENVPGMPPGASEDASLAGIEAQVDQAQMAYDQAVNALDDAEITSPVEGVVSQVNINEGGIATNAQPAVVILDISDMYVEIDVPENMVSVVHEGLDADINISAVNRTSKGVVENISPSPDERTQLYKSRILINEVLKDVKAGMFVKVNFDINSKQDIIAVKSDIIIEDGEKNYVFIAEKDKAVKKLVELGIESGEYTEIVKGLQEDQEVLVKGQDYVEDGTELKVIRGES